MTDTVTDSFAAASAVTPLGDGSYSVDLHPSWTIGGKTNGGYLLAVLGRAAVAAVPDHPHPLAATAHYLSSPPVGPATVVVTVLRQGRSASQVRTELQVDGVTRVDATLTLGRLGDATPWYSDVPPVAIPAESDCFLLPEQGPGFEVKIMGVVHERLDPVCLGGLAGAPTGHGELRAWVRLADGSDFDTLGLLFAVDALPPATFDLGTTGWVPTLGLTAHVLGVPAPGALLVRQKVRQVGSDLLDELCDVWDSTGTLVATGTQLAALRTPATPPATP